MNRVIKFRLWDVQNEEYYTEGFSVAMDGLFWYDSNEFSYKITPETYILEQFTGLHDKNGVEIYEGDECLINGRKSKNTIYWDYEVSGFCYENGDFAYQLARQNVIEITGNIHQPTTP